MKPAAMKEGKLYSQQPHSGAGDFNFSRADGVQTRINKHGLIETVADNVPRLSYDIVDGKVSDCPHLLLEPSRTNSLTYSTLAFNGGSTPTGWSVGFGTGTFSHTETIYKGQGAVKHTQSTTGRSYLSETISLSASTTYILRVEFDRNNSNLDDNDYIVATANMSNSFAKQWADVDDDGILEVQFTTGTDATGELRLGFGVTGNEDGGKTIVFSMPQIEAGSYATSYIPTSGSTETRQADLCNGSGNSETFNDSEGVLFAEIAALSNDGTSRRLSISDGSNRNQVSIIYGSSNSISPTIYSGNSFQMGGSHTLTDQTDTIKVALKYSANDAALWVNGIEVLIDPIVTTPIGLNQARFEYGGGSNDFYGKVKELTVINEALTDEQLQILTTP